MFIPPSAAASQRTTRTNQDETQDATESGASIAIVAVVATAAAEQRDCTLSLTVSRLSRRAGVPAEYYVRQYS